MFKTPHTDISIYKILLPNYYNKTITWSVVREGLKTYFKFWTLTEIKRDGCKPNSYGILFILLKSF